MKVRDMLAELHRLGCTPARTAQSTSHKIWKTPSGQIVPLSVKHLNDEVPIGTRKQIERRLATEGLLLRKS